MDYRRPELAAMKKTKKKGGSPEKQGTLLSPAFIPLLFLIGVLVLLIGLIIHSGTRIIALNAISEEVNSVISDWDSLDRLTNNILLNNSITDRDGYRSMIRTKSAWTTQTIEFSYSLNALKQNVEANMDDSASSKLQEALNLWQVTLRNLQFALRTLDTILLGGPNEIWSDGLLHHYYRYRDTEALSFDMSVSIMNFFNEISILDVSSTEFSRIIDTTGELLREETRNQIQLLIALIGTLVGLMFLSIFILFRMIMKAAGLEKDKQSLKQSSRSAILGSLLENENADEKVFIRTRDLVGNLDLFMPQTFILFRISDPESAEGASLNTSGFPKRGTLETVLHEIINQFHPDQIVFTYKGDTIALINDHPENNVDWLKRVGDIRHRFSERIGMNIFGVFEAGLDNYTELAECYHRILDTSRYRFVYGIDTLLPTSIVIDHEDNDFKYPLSQEIKINDLVKQDKTAEAEELFDKVIESVMSNTYPVIKMTCLRLTSSIMDTLQLMVMNYSQSSYDNILHEGYDISLLESLPEIKRRLFQLVTRISNMLKQVNSKKHEEIIDRIQDTIENQFRDPNLSLEALADLVNLSPVYIGRIYKRIASQSIADTINERRLEEACRNLRNTGETIGSICHDVGFSNETYFYTLFRKKFSVTPTRFRSNLADNQA